ncbi:hypothetical protein [Nocardia anaemiae]|uniref:hypothetical protein n=1 Tax=Nocardia anaemiae TaxID=263910 RepID=UPI0007A39536|nr:hypothetical protein [Nocardia anaemiae]
MTIAARAEVMGFGESRVVEMGEARVVDRFADLDRHLSAVGVEDDLPRPDSVHGVARDSARGQDFGFLVAACVVPAVGSGVVEGGVHVDAVRVVELMHVQRLPVGAVG